MNWFKRKTEEEKQLEVQARKLRVEKLIAKEGGALESLKGSLCLNNINDVYLFCGIEFNDVVDDLAYIVQYRDNYVNKTSEILSKCEKDDRSDSKWMQSVAHEISRDRSRFLELRATLESFGITLELNNKVEKNEE